MRSWPPTHNALQLDMPMPPLPQGTIWRPMSLPPGDLPFALQHCNTTCILVSILYSGGGGGVSLCPSSRVVVEGACPCIHPIDSGDRGGVSLVLVSILQTVVTAPRTVSPPPTYTHTHMLPRPHSSLHLTVVSFTSPQQCSFVRVHCGVLQHHHTPEGIKREIDHNSKRDHQDTNEIIKVGTPHPEQQLACGLQHCRERALMYFTVEKKNNSKS